MNERDFLRLAKVLAGGAFEADWRTAVGRAYYAAFHVARHLLEALGFRVPAADRAHAYLAFRLQNCGDPPVVRAGADLQRLRQDRNKSDYDLRLRISQAIAQKSYQKAEQIIRTLDAVRPGPASASIVNAIRAYERNVLGDVTWQGP